LSNLATNHPSGPRLNEAARLLVTSAIIAGLNNTQIRERLRDAGHAEVSNQALRRYRGSAEVREARDAVMCETLDAGYISLYGRLVLLNSQVEEMLQVQASYGVREEVIGIDKDGNTITRVVDDRKTREYNELYHVRLSYLREISRLVDHPRRMEPLPPPAVPTLAEQIRDTMETLLRRPAGHPHDILRP
jgi:hypothetical protein